MNMSEGTHRGQKSVLHPLELELQAVVSCQLNSGPLQEQQVCLTIFLVPGAAVAAAPPPPFLR